MQNRIVATQTNQYIVYSHLDLIDSLRIYENYGKTLSLVTNFCACIHDNEKWGNEVGACDDN